MIMNVPVCLVLALVATVSRSEFEVSADSINGILRLNSGQDNDLVVTHQHSHPQNKGYLEQLVHLLVGLPHILGYQSGKHRVPRDTYNNSDDSQKHERKDNCTDPRHPPQSYRDSCHFIHVECAKNAELIDYMAFVVCDLSTVQPLGFILMALWAVYLISLLATTVDIFFVPPLTFLADKLNLSPSIAGITLLALGNGAPDIFVAFSGILQDDLALVLGALSGGAMFITTVVLGCVILVSRVSPFGVDGIDFMRDVIAFMCVVSGVIAVAFDGKVHLIEACLFPLFYIVYIAVVISMSYFRAWLKKKKQPDKDDMNDDSNQLVDRLNRSETSNPPIVAATFTHSILVENIIREPVLASEDNDERQLLTQDDKEEKYGRNYLPGLSWPRKAHWILKVIWFVQWPFSLIRWITIPSFGHSGQWSTWHYIFTALSPVPMSMILLLTTKGWKGFTLNVGPVPLPVLLVILALLLSVTLFIFLRRKRPPHWCLQILLVPMAFIMAIVWLNLEANEIVSILRAFGLLLNIDTAILGLTVLALGNCAADWVADIVVARAGKTEMAIASCFGSPMLSHVLGLSIAMIVRKLIKITIFNQGRPYQFHIHSSLYTDVKFSWIFLGLSLLVNIITFPLFRFSPPKIYGFVLMSIYSVFVITAILVEVGIIPVYF